MNENCLIQRIAIARGILQPTVLRAILNLYQEGQQQMTARQVKDKCYQLDNTRYWDGRLPAICNAMRNATECGGQVVGADGDFLEFTISF